MGIIMGLWGSMYGFAGRRDEGNHRTGFFSKHNYMAAREAQSACYGTYIEGVSISIGGVVEALVNHATRANGLQIGLINNCRTGKLVQIGLFNRIGNRVVPFVNLRFGKEPGLGEEYGKRYRKDRNRRMPI